MDLTCGVCSGCVCSVCFLQHHGEFHSERPAFAWVYQDSISCLAGVQSRWVAIRTRVPQFFFLFFFLGDCSAEAWVSGGAERESRKLKNTKTRVTPTKQEKAPAPPENRDSRRNSNASRVGGGVHIHAYTVIVYTHYDPNALIPPPRVASRHTERGCPRYNYWFHLSFSRSSSLSITSSQLFFKCCRETRLLLHCEERQKTLKENPRSRAQMSARPWSLDSRTVGKWFWVFL